MADVKSLRELDEPILAEIVREAETLVASQYQSHLASEQRGYTFAGLALAASSAAFGAFAKFEAKTSAEVFQSNLGLWFAVGLFIAGSCSIISVWPRTFCIPGNEPVCWLPHTWPAHVQKNLKSTRLEQATVLQGQISKNRKTARLKAIFQQISILSAYLTVFICGMIWLLNYSRN